MGFSDNATNTEAFLFLIAMMKLNTCRVILTTLYTAQFALVSIEPLFLLLAMLPAFLKSALSISLIPPPIVLPNVCSTLFIIFECHGSLLTSLPAFIVRNLWPSECSSLACFA